MPPFPRVVSVCVCVCVRVCVCGPNVCCCRETTVRWIDKNQIDCFFTKLNFTIRCFLVTFSSLLLYCTSRRRRHHHHHHLAAWYLLLNVTTLTNAPFKCRVNTLLRITDAPYFVKVRVVAVCRQSILSSFISILIPHSIYIYIYICIYIYIFDVAVRLFAMTDMCTRNRQTQLFCNIFSPLSVSCHL